MRLVRKDNHAVSIVGTLETVYGTAGLSGGERLPDGTLDLWYGGDTGINWDSQTTVLGPNRERTFIDEDGKEVPESQVDLIPDNVDGSGS